jgi:hypothetical protein
VLNLFSSTYLRKLFAVIRALMESISIIISPSSVVILINGGEVLIGKLDFEQLNSNEIQMITNNNAKLFLRSII